MVEENTLKARIDLKKASVVGDVKLGDTVRVVLVGRVVEMKGPEERIGLDYGGLNSKAKPKEKEFTYPGMVCVEFKKLEIESQSEFEEPEDD